MIPTRKSYAVAWSLWLAAGLAIELIAASDPLPGATFTAHSRRLTRTRSGKAILAAGLLLAGAHLLAPTGGYVLRVHGRASGGLVAPAPYPSATPALLTFSRATETAPRPNRKEIPQ